MYLMDSNIVTSSDHLWSLNILRIITVCLFEKGLMNLDGYYFGFTRVAIDILSTDNSSVSLLPASMNCIKLISMIWKLQSTSLE
jgi:hypothetical protein